MGFEPTFDPQAVYEVTPNPSLNRAEGMQTRVLCPNVRVPDTKPNPLQTLVSAAVFAGLALSSLPAVLALGIGYLYLGYVGWCDR